MGIAKKPKRDSVTKEADIDAFAAGAQLQDKSSKSSGSDKSAGRPSHKVPGVKYVKVNMEIPDELKKKIQHRVLDGEFISLQHAINVALEKL